VLLHTLRFTGLPLDELVNLCIEKENLDAQRISARVTSLV
jgi:hypothetical protein